MSEVPSRWVCVGAVARLAFRESARHRVLHALIAAMLVSSAVSHLLAWVSGDEPARQAQVIANLSLASISLLSVLAAIFLGTHLVYQEVERRTIYSVLARPLDRWGFLLGKYLGLLGIMGVALGIMSVGFFVSYALGNPPELANEGVRGLAETLGRFSLALGMLYLEVAVVTGVALLFSVAAHPIEGAVFAFIVAMAGHMTGSLNELGQELLRRVGDDPPLAAVALQKLLFVLYVLLPNLENFNVRPLVVHGLPVPAEHVVLALAYAVLYGGLLLTLSGLTFRRRIL